MDNIELNIIDTNKLLDISKIKVRNNVFVYEGDLSCKNGFEFAGFYYDKSYKILYDNEPINGDITLYAKWNKIDEKSVVLINFMEKLMKETDGYIPSWNKETFKGMWNYIDGVFLNSIVNAYYEYKKNNIYKAKMYKAFFLNYVDYYIANDGSFICQLDKNKSGFKTGELDTICESKILFDAYEMTKNEKYLNAIENTYKSLMNQSRVKGADALSNFSHKEIYPNQIWLDGMYMYVPFYARYALLKKDLSIFNEIKDQYQNIRKYMFDENTKLYCHAYDHSRQIFWANKVNGKSECSWLRSTGWFIVSLVDVLDYFPDSKERIYLINMLREAIMGVLRYENKDNHMFYQIIDKGEQEYQIDVKKYLLPLQNYSYGQDKDVVTIKNYLESSGSSMIAYSILKAVRKSYIDVSYKKIGLDIFTGIYNYSFNKETLDLHDICITAGLGPENKPYRDGTPAYYLAEKVGCNDAKGVGPFLMAYLEYAINKK